jgi:hypothetical protein
MKKFILFLVLTHPICASTHKYIRTVSELKDHLEVIITRQKRNPRDLKYLHNNIKLVHGFYYIEQGDSFFIDLLKSLNRENRFFVLKAQFIIHYQYNEKEDIEIKYNMGVTETLKFFDQKLKAGLKFSRESRYLIYKEEDLLRFLPVIASNRSDSVLIMKYCRKSPCVRNRKILAKIPDLMNKNDGMSLRISSKFDSQEKNKLQYIKDRLQPFTPKD